MAELGVVVSSSFHIPPSSPSRRSSRRNLRLSPQPLLSDVRIDLTAPASSSEPSTRRLLKYYARLASKIARDGRFTDFLMIAESVLTSDAVAAESSQFVARVDTRMISRGIHDVLRNGGLNVVLDFLNGAERLGFCPASFFDEAAIGALGVECRRLVERRRLEEFVEIMETLADYQFFVKEVVDPDVVLRIFVQRRNVDMAVRYASIFPHSQLLLCSVMNEFGKKRDLKSAIRTFEAIKATCGGYNMFACRSIIDICGLCGDLLKSRSIFEEMLAQKITPNTYVFNSLMNVNARDLSYTLHVYRHMQALCVTLDVASYNIILKACCNAKRVDLAQDVYKEMKDLQSMGVFKLDVITYSTMIKVFADAKLSQMALNVKEDMLWAGVDLNIVAWSSLISAFTNAGDVDHALQMFEKMIRAGCAPNAQCCNILLNAFVESCQYDRAFRLFYTWKESGFKVFQNMKKREHDNTHDSSIPDQLTGDGHTQSICLYDSKPLGNMVVVPFRPTVATFNILMKACGSDHYRAKSLMDEMKIMDLSPNHISWSILINIYGTSQDIWGAIQAFKTMHRFGIKPDVIAYTTAIKACVENENPKMAFILFEEMKRHKIQPNLVTYNTLLRALTRYGSLHDVQQCLAMYQDMRKAGYNSIDYHLKELLEEWCEGVLSGGNQNKILAGAGRSHTMKKPYSLLIEKVATHLQKDVGDNQAIDIRGLTKVEARIIVLSVLRMIKERYQSGKPIEDDILIISGIRKYVNDAASHEPDVQHAIIKVLQDELGLEVNTGHGTGPVGNSKDQKYQARRPQDIGLLKVTKESLCHWLQRKNRQ
ncbi:HCP-like protein [Dioscorea alata]|uniref:HCP-like protein n=1 Tax=Dioscorea alata TaxID=55571 RepID=A0ACB7V3K6_DIOAL|nr:HCP-like protein [Dioscorea alata]